MKVLLPDLLIRNSFILYHADNNLTISWVNDIKIMWRFLSRDFPHTVTVHLTLLLFNNEFQVHKRIKSDNCDLEKNLILKVSFWVLVENMVMVNHTIGSYHYALHFMR